MKARQLNIPSDAAAAGSRSRAATRADVKSKALKGRAATSDGFLEMIFGLPWPD